MTERSYSFDEITRMSKALDYLMRTDEEGYYWDFLPEATIEDRLRTCLFAGISVEDLEDRVKNLKLGRNHPLLKAQRQ